MEENRYIRQRDIIGDEGQRRLSLAHVLVVGAGGLGSPLLYYLAAAGVGELTIVDDDTVSASNLNRQILYEEADIGSFKAKVAAKRLAAFNPHIKVNAVVERFTEQTGEELLAGVSAAAACVDTRAARLTINRICCRVGIPVVDAGVEGYIGYITAVIPQKTPCLECWFDNADVSPEKCGVLGAAAGIVGSLQAQMLLRILLGKEENAGKLYLLDTMEMKMDEIRAKINEKCGGCGGL